MTKLHAALTVALASVFTCLVVLVDLPEDDDVRDAITDECPPDPATGVCAGPYCEAFPHWCQFCDQAPCGVSSSLVCCDRAGCMTVNNYADCAAEIYWCLDGYQGRNPDGSPYVICFDED